MSKDIHISPKSTDDQEVLVRVEGVSKKFCRSLKQSLWYGLADMAGELNPFAKVEKGPTNGHAVDELRPGEFWANKDISFELRRGECLGLIGHNGAGKTTLLKMLNGLIKPDAGSITMRGRIGALIALGAGFNPILTGRENIYVNGSILGAAKEEIDQKIDEIIDFADVRGFIDAPVQSYSSGMSVRLGFAIAAFQKPDIMLLDEVLAVGDIAFQSKCFNTLSKFREQGTGFILVSHSMHQITRYCDRVIHLRHGTVGVEGRPEEAISQFIADMDAKIEKNEAAATDFSQVYGSGKLQITGARFLGSDRNPLHGNLSKNSNFTLCLDFVCPAPPQHGVTVEVMIRDREGIFYQGTSGHDGKIFDVTSNQGSFEIAFPCLPSTAAELRFFVALMDSRTREVHDWKRNILLINEGRVLSSGRVLLEPLWNLI